ncbi:MAG TPA: PKD domain-containing protein [Baekduia sp.]|nr:PKD domain-containing protein [Baekduia sp.]
MGDQTLSRRQSAVGLAAAGFIGALALVTATLLLSTASARAVILPALTIDGPSEDIIAFGGVAMAEDGTGGAVYLKRVEGLAHVFVARYVEHRWLAPIRADTAEPYAASWARIGAADGGELEVVWATPFATQDSRPVEELLGATLGPGSAAFGPAMIVDPDVRGGTGTSPDLAMSATGQADVVYRVVNESTSSSALLRPGDVIEEVRVAHFNGETWSRLGSINRNSGVSMRAPSEANAPRIAIGPTGNGVVVWQEPEITGVSRIWARRVFGRSLDYVLPVSAASLSGAPLTTDADAPSVAISRLGEAVVAYRQAAGAGSPLPGARILVNTLPDGESADGSQFSGATVADSEVPGGASASVGPPSIDIDEKQNLRLLYSGNGVPRVVEGNGRGLSRALSLGPSFAGVEPFSASVMNPAGGGVSAWPSADSHGAPSVAVREDFPAGGVQTALLASPRGGPVSELAVARSGLGDGIVGFRSGPVGQAAIVISQVTAPPAQLVVSVPKTWVRPSGAALAWQPAASAQGPLRYEVVLDGRRLRTPAGAYRLRVPRTGLGDGRHRVQVLATDLNGESLLTSAAVLRVDGSAPTVRIGRRRGGAVIVRVHDDASGVDAHATAVSFGDGRQARGRARVRHAYSHPGIYQLVIKVRDKVGNSGALRRYVSVR